MSRSVNRWVRIMTWLVLALLAGTCLGQDEGSAKLFDTARRDVAAIRSQIQQPDLPPGTLAGLRDQALGFVAQADALIADRTPKLQEVEKRLAELGPAPGAGGPAEATDIAAQRTSLGRSGAEFDSQIKRAKLLSADAQQLLAEIAEVRRAQFQAGLTQRTTSPLSAEFWRALGANAERDRARLQDFRNETARSLGSAFAPGNRLASVLGVGIGLVLLLFGRWLAEKWLVHLASRRMPHGHMRRSSLALAIVLIGAILPGLGAQAMRVGLDWKGALGPTVAQMAQLLVYATWFGGFMVGLGRALLSVRRPSWRMLPIPDVMATGLRWFPLLFTLAAMASVVLARFNSITGASLTVTITTSVVIAVLVAGLMAWALLHLRAARRAAAAELPASPWLGLVLFLAWLTVVLTVLCAATGYVAMAHFLARQMIWLSVIAATYYLLVTLVDDLCAVALSSQGHWAQESAMEPGRFDQLSVLLAGAFRVVAFVFAAVMVLVPLGAAPSELMQRARQLANGWTIGQIQFTPGAVLGGVVVFVVGMFLIQRLRRWLAERYLPTTRLEPGMRTSITTLFGYFGGVVIFALALSALGLSLERITWIASALSVGIGFGLQAIVQNFISGLIMLVERPVKVGDLVALGDIEGDIRRINVRATEIRLFDRSTLIVPNSEFITKTVRNLTLANAEGRVRIRLPVPLGTDAHRVRELTLEVLAAQPGLLATPAPSVLLDSIDGTMLIFYITAFISSPRQTGGARNALLLDLLARLREEGVLLNPSHEVNVRTTPAPPPSPPEPTPPLQS